MSENLKSELAEAAARKELYGETEQTEEVKTEAVTEESKEEVKEEREFTELELEQMGHGWDPDKPDGVSAKEFKRVGEIIEAKRLASKKAELASKEVTELNETVKKLIAHNKAVEEATRKKVLAEIESKKLAAVEQGDVQAFKLAEAEQAKLAFEQAKEEQEAVKPLSQDVIDFQEENKDWLTSKKPGDVAMQAYVKARVDDYMATNPNIDEKVAIASIKEGLKEEFPHKFTNPNKEKPSKTMKSTAPNKTSYSSSRLTYEQKHELDSIRKADPTYTAEEYIKQLELIGRLEK